MKVIIILFLLLLTATAFGELTKEDLRTIIKEEVRPIIKEEIAASEKRTREYIDLKIDGLDKSLNAKIDAVDQRIDDLKGNVNRIWLAIIALIAAAVALPQLIIAYTERKRQKDIEKRQEDLQTEIQQLREKIEAMSQ